MSSFNWSPLGGGGGGTKVTTLDGMSGALTLVAGTGISITDDTGAKTITITATGGGDVTLGAFGSTPNANGLSLSSQVLNMQPADATHPGGISVADWNTFNSKQAALTIGNLTAAGTDGIAVTSGTGAIIGSGTSIAQHVSDASHNGYLSSTDWSTFNAKQAALTLGNLTEATSAVLTITGGSSAIIGSGLTIQVKLAATAQSGYLSSTDWNTFNNKQAALTLTNLTDVGTDGITITNGTGAVVGASPVTIAQHVADTTHNGYLSSTDWNTFNNKGSGSVTSIAMTVPSFLSIAGTPITTSGTLALTLSGTALPLANGGTGQTTKAAAFDALSPMTTGGDLIYGGASGTGTRLANGSAGQVLTSAGTTVAPTWSTPSVTAITLLATGSPPTGTFNSATYSTIIYGTTVEATGITYNNTTGVATIVTAGVYSISASIAIAGTGVVNGYEALRINKNNGTNVATFDVPTVTATTLQRGILATMSSIRLAANDTIRIQAYSDGLSPSYASALGPLQFSMSFIGI